MSAWNWRFTTDGKLCLLPWRFGKPSQDCAHEPHRCTPVCEFKTGSTTFSLIHNRYAKAWYLNATCPGWGGPHSRAINCIRTKSPKIFEAWKKAIESGNVEILER